MASVRGRAVRALLHLLQGHRRRAPSRGRADRAWNRGAAVRFYGLGPFGRRICEHRFFLERAGSAAGSRLDDGEGMPVQLLIGHSLGGAAAIAAAPRLPGVRAVATIGAPHEPGHVLHNWGPSWKHRAEGLGAGRWPGAVSRSAANLSRMQRRFARRGRAGQDGRRAAGAARAARHVRGGRKRAGHFHRRAPSEKLRVARQCRPFAVDAPRMRAMPPMSSRPGPAATWRLPRPAPTPPDLPEGVTRVSEDDPMADCARPFRSRASMCWLPMSPPRWRHRCRADALSAAGRRTGRLHHDDACACMPSARSWRWTMSPAT